MSEPVISHAASLRGAIAAIERGRKLIAVVVDDDGRLLGILSDGDIRRAILAGRTLESPAMDAMTRTPIVVSSRLRDDEILHLLVTRGVAAAPVVDDAGRFLRVAQIADFESRTDAVSSAEGYAATVIMAGGEGRRLLPFTMDRPKPMIDIGGVPLLERQIRALVSSGLKRIYVSTNYLGHIIESHFGDGTAFGASIQYLRERKKLGTAGALALLPPLDGPLLVINGDILTRSDFGKLLTYHRETAAFISVSAIVYRVEVPFGVLRLQDGRAVGVEEKPSENFLCNAGIYALSPEALRLVPADTETNMTDVIANAIAAGHRVSVFPIHEYWSDIGNPGDLQRALAEFAEATS